MMRADLHVHTSHSKRTGNLQFLGSRDCYSDPLDVYHRAKARGMDLVAITDHDTIDGALELMQRLPNPDEVIMGEEVSCLYEGLEVHFGVYGITESIHRDVQALRHNAAEVASFLRGAGLFFSLNHLLHFYRDKAPLPGYLRLLNEVPALEVRNGAMLPAHNLLIEEIASRWNAGSNQSRIAMIGGSDAHTLRRIGRTWTEAPGRDREEFLDSLKRGLGRPGGDHGGASAVAGDAYGVIRSFVGSLMGLGPRDHVGWHRAACLAFTAMSIPWQFLPVAIALAGKRREARCARVVTAQLGSLLVQEPNRSLQVEEALL